MSLAPRNHGIGMPQHYCFTWCGCYGDACECQRLRRVITQYQADLKAKLEKSQTYNKTPYFWLGIIAEQYIAPDKIK